MNLVSMVRESSSELLNGTFKSWLENNWGHLTWEHSKGDEGSDSIEYKSGNYTATYTRIMDGSMTDENTYSPMRDDSLTFIEEVVPMADKDEDDYETEDNEGTMTKEEMLALKEGELVNHKNYGLCKVMERTMPIGVDLEILTPGNECLGHFKQILETRHSLITKVKPVTSEQFEKAFNRGVKKTLEGRAKWQQDILRNQL